QRDEVTGARRRHRAPGERRRAELAGCCRLHLGDGTAVLEIEDADRLEHLHRPTVDRVRMRGLAAQATVWASTILAYRPPRAMSASCRPDSSTWPSART